MNKTRIFSLLAIIGLLSCSGSRHEKPSDVKTQQRLIFNCDGTVLLGNYMFGGLDGRPLSLADVHAYVDAYAQTPITTFMMCSGAHNLYYRSAFTRVIGETPKEMSEGTYQDPENVGGYYRNFLNVEREGADVITAVLQRAQEHHLETFISYRMNDLHFNELSQTPLSQCEFWQNHPEYWIHEDFGWHSDGAFDFAHAEVRQFKTDIIAEQLDKYGHLLDGFDLDFLRFPAYFKTAEAAKNAPLMTELVRTVKQKIDETSKRTGRHILLSARVPFDMDFCLSEGLDVKEWIKLGLIDFLTVGNFFTENPDFSMSVAKSIQDIGSGEHRLPIYVSMESGSYSPRQQFSHGMYRGIASHIYAQGGEGIYLFNYFFDNPSVSLSCNTVCREISSELLSELGSTETLRKRNKIYALDDGSAASYYRFRGKSPLPLTLSSTDRQTVDIHIDDDTQQDVPEQIILFIRTNQQVETDVQVNGIDATPLGTDYISLYEADADLKKGEQVHVFSVPVSAVKQGRNTIGIRAQSAEKTPLTSHLSTLNSKVVRLEMAIRYGDVSMYGYF